MQNPDGFLCKTRISIQNPEISIKNTAFQLKPGHFYTKPAFLYTLDFLAKTRRNFYTKPGLLHTNARISIQNPENIEFNVLQPFRAPQQSIRSSVFFDVVDILSTHPQAPLFRELFSSLNSPIKATHVEHKRKLEVMKEIFFYGKLMTFTVKTRSS